MARKIARVSRPEESFFIPDICVIPRDMQRRPRRMEAYPEPLPLVVEIWSPSTDEYDIDSKLSEYRERGDDAMSRDFGDGSASGHR